MFTKSFWIAGFECFSHRRRNSRRLDLIASTGHDRHAAAEDNRAPWLAYVGEEVRAAIRQGIPTHQIDPFIDPTQGFPDTVPEEEEEEITQHAACG